MPVLNYLYSRFNPSHTRHGRPKGSHPRNRLWVAVVVLGILLSGPVREALACWYDPIIFDPQALVEHGLQLLQLQEQVSQSLEQLRLQALELTQLGANLAPDVIASLQTLDQSLQLLLYADLAPGVQLETRFPASLATTSWTDFLNLQVQ